ncbi:MULTISPECIES: hypothetical protein [Arthrobacter]|uniref:8-oxo-dGTP diphosphatase n=1 Tax=Arthrobacter nanjingensis TaxID=1387716 RepID=A0ABU9KL15_9MICC
MSPINQEHRPSHKPSDTLEVTTTAHPYDFGTVNLTTFYCELVSGEPQLTEHADVVWLSPDELGSLDWAPADIPAVELIQGALARNG